MFEMKCYTVSRYCLNAEWKGAHALKQNEKAQKVDGLMKHLRDDCGIAISGSEEKKKLMQYGYYHGYKGYRFYKKDTNLIPYTKFSEIVAVIEYDNELKKLVYPTLMFLETAIKNIVLEQVVPEMKDPSIDSIYRTKMIDEPQNNKLRLKRLTMRDRVHAMLSDNYKHGKEMIAHFYNRGQEVPIWAVFEILMLGDFANFVVCLDKNTRQKIARALNMTASFDTNCQLLPNAILTIKSIRNATAHNSIVFDTRFKDRNVNKNLITWVKMETGIKNISFDYFTDYIALIVCLLKHLQYPKRKLLQLIKEYTDIVDNLYRNVSVQIHNKVVATGIQGKLSKLEQYINI